MEAEYCQDGTIAVSGTARIESFNRMWAGIGWPDRELGYICVVGERTDGRYHVLWEKNGGLWELGDSALQAKDRLLIECIWVDARDSLATSYLRTVEGLCFYDDATSSVQDPAGTAATPAAGVLTHRTPIATVMPVPERVAANYRSALEKTRGVILRGDLLIYEKNCPKLVYTMRQPLEDLLKSPTMKALVWVVTALEHAKGNGTLDLDAPDPWYSNVPRQDP